MPSPPGAPSSYTPRHLADRILASRSAIEGERKQVTVLFCDVAESAGLVHALGPEGAHALFSDFFGLVLDVVHDYEGTINQFLGDGFMALFGAPLAHEDHARQAVLAALGIRDAVAGADVRIPRHLTLRLRMGLNSGEVVVGSIGDDLRMDYTAFGDTSVLAARLQGAAHPDEILISEGTARIVEGYVLTEPREPVQVKAQIVRPVRVLTVGPRVSRVDTAIVQRLSRFVGRERELERLRRLLEDARAGHGRLVTISGVPGIGKSRVLHEVRCAAAEVGLAYAEGRCLSVGRSMAYRPVLELLRRRCDIADDDPRDAVATKLSSALEASGADVARALPFLLRMHGHHDESGEIAILDPATVKGRTFAALHAVLLGSGERPVVLVVEDMHWIDGTSEELLTSLSARAAERAVLIIATTRPEYSPPWDGEQIVLDAMSRRDSEAVVGSLLGAGGTEEIVAAIIDRAEGNPLFLEELAGAVNERGTSAVLALPGTVQSVLAARIDRLPEAAKRALQTASVLGRRFPLAYLEQIWREPHDLRTQLALLATRDLLHGDDGASPSFSFKHALTQEVAYTSLLLVNRERLHTRVGAALEAIHAERIEEYVEVIAHHYSRGGDAEKAFYYLAQANAKAARANAMQEATAYFYDALKALDRLPDTEQNRRRRLAMLLDQTGEFHLLHKHREYYELLVEHQELARELADPGLLGEFYARLGHRQWTILADMEQATATLTRAAALCEQAGRHLGAASAFAILEWSHLFMGPLEHVEHYLRLARQKLTCEFHPHWYMWALSAAVIAHTHAGRWTRALAIGEEALEVGSARSEDGIVSFAAAWLAYACLERGDPAETTRYARLGISRAPTVYFQGFSHAHLAAAACRTGKPAEGVPTLEAIAGAIKASEHVPAWMHMATLLAEGQLAAGDSQAAAVTAGAVADCSARAPAPYYSAAASRVLAEVALERGDLGEAERRIEAGLSASRRIGAENATALALGLRGRLHLERGDSAPARRDLRTCLEAFERLGIVEPPERVRSALAAAGLSSGP
jgi:class 3 adenylate cyclase/tetratricopeptide (TPR) repeat protein